jgi:hypothetical protein
MCRSFAMALAAMPTGEQIRDRMPGGEGAPDANDTEADLASEDDADEA